MLWINKIIKVPQSSMTTDSNSFNQLVTELICSLSHEFGSHRHELKVYLEHCRHGGAHKKVSFSDLIYYSAKAYI